MARVGGQNRFSDVNARLPFPLFGHQFPAGYAKHAEVTVPSLDDWERNWEKHFDRAPGDGSGLAP